jgi:hypothetical protein
MSYFNKKEASKTNKYACSLRFFKNQGKESLFKIKADPFPYDDRFFFFGIKEIYIF